MNLRNIFTRANVLSAKRHNAVANVVNSLANLKVVRGSKDALYVSDVNAILELRKVPADLAALGVVTVNLCDPATGQVTTYELYGREA